MGTVITQRRDSIEIDLVVIGDDRRPLGDITGLIESIREIGLLNPITVTEDMRLVGGNHRLHACKALGWARIPAVVLTLDALRAKLAEIDENLCRNELTALERAEQLAERKKVYEALHPQTRPVNERGGPGRGKKTNPESGSVSAPAFIDDAASKTGRSRTVVAEEVQIAQAIAPEVKDAIRSTPIADSKTDLLTLAKMPTERQVEVAEKVTSGGAKTVKEAVASIKLDEKRALAAELDAAPVPLPGGRYHVIAIDPPWKYDARAEDASHRGRNQYPDMTIEQLCALPVADLAETDCVLWLWTTNAFMREAYQLLDAWGFAAKTILTWDKQLMGLGDYLRNVTEHCIVAVRGRPVLTLTNQTTLISERRREHSRKPDAFYALVESLCHGAKVEMFARAAREGWAAWGAETEKFGGSHAA